MFFTYISLFEDFWTDRERKIRAGLKNGDLLLVNWKPLYDGYVTLHEMLCLELSKDLGKRSKAENKGKKKSNA